MQSKLNEALAPAIADYGTTLVTDVCNDADMKAALQDLTPDQQAAVNEALQKALGSAELDDASAALYSGLAELHDGAEALHNGAQEFSDKVEDELSDDLGSGLQDIVRRLKAMQQAGKAYQSFAGLADGMTGNVKFIVETAEIQ